MKGCENKLQIGKQISGMLTGIYETFFSRHGYMCCDKIIYRRVTRNIFKQNLKIVNFIKWKSENNPEFLLVKEFKF